MTQQNSQDNQKLNSEELAQIASTDFASLEDSQFKKLSDDDFGFYLYGFYRGYLAAKNPANN